ncbi:hypothetical protein RF55_6553, partial [Lasius niger]
MATITCLRNEVIVVILDYTGIEDIMNFKMHVEALPIGSQGVLGKKVLSQ